MGNDKLWPLLITALFLIMASSCQNPCRDLSYKICDCKQNPSERDACREGLKLPSSYDSFSELEGKSSEQCEEAINNCTCEDINAGRLSQCGASRQ